MAKVKVLLTRVRSVIETAEVEVEVDDFKAGMLGDAEQMKHWALAEVVPGIRNWQTFAKPDDKVEVVGKVLDEKSSQTRASDRQTTDEKVVHLLH